MPRRVLHSDDHVATGDIPVGVYPFCGGHEGAGVVTAVGPTAGLTVGDHVRLLVPADVRALHLVRRGVQNLCDLGASLLAAPAGTTRRAAASCDGQPVGQMCGITTFPEVTGRVDSAVEVPATSRSTRPA